jgi:hypothetical protein
MQPTQPFWRHARMLRLARALAALSLAGALSVVPLATVSACSCAMSELPQAIQTADLAIVATSISVEPLGKGEMGERLATTWDVERSRDPLDARLVSIESWADGGANCGISFGTNERWLVLAYRGDSALETNSCMLNRRLDGSEPDTEALITEMLMETPSAAAAESGIDIPIPILAIAGAVVLVGAVSVVAFRRAEAR